jgi:N-methylhydantoinase B
MADASDPEVRKRACAPYASSVSVAVFAGSDKKNAYHVFVDMSALAVGAGASPAKDGLDAGGCQPLTEMRMPDVESYEQAYPILFLWRSLSVDSGGAGQHRGGTGTDVAWTLWGADAMDGITNSASWQVPAPGSAGGYPGSATELQHIALERLEHAPGDGAALPPTRTLPEGRQIAAKAAGIHLVKGDVWRMRYPGGGGWGDPLDRAPDQVVADVSKGTVSPRAAREAYGVVLTVDGHDASETDRLRAAMRAGRLRDSEHAEHGVKRRVRNLADALVGNGAFAYRREDLNLIEEIDGETGNLVSVGHMVSGSAPELAVPDQLLL